MRWKHESDPVTPQSVPGTALRRFVAPRPAVERCELCDAAVGPHHPHLVEPKTRRLLCACDACAFLFEHDTRGRYRRVPRDASRVEHGLSEAAWQALQIPVGLSFFFLSSLLRTVIGIYPGPAGPMESTVEAAAWSDACRESPCLADLKPDTEALLVNRMREARDHFVVPIDRCYRLVGLFRSHWEGFSGGETLWREVEKFFDALREDARPPRTTSEAGFGREGRP